MADLPITSDEGATPIVINDPTTTANVANVKAASTASVAGDASLVVALSPNSPTPLNPDRTGSGTIAALNGSVVVSTQGCASVTFNLTGTWSGTLTCQGTTDGTNWFIVYGVLVGTTAPTQTVSSSNQPIAVTIPCGSLLQVRLLATVFVSGTVNVAWNAGAGAKEVIVLSPVASSFNVTVTGNVGVTQGSTTSGELGVLDQGAVTTASPTYVTGQTSPLSLTLAGALRVDGSAVTQPVSQATAANLNATVVGNLTNNNAAPAANNIGVLPAVAAAAAPTWTSGDQVLLSENLSGFLRVVDSSDGSVTGGTAGVTSMLIGGTFNTTVPAYTNLQQGSIQLDTRGAIQVTRLDGCRATYRSGLQFTAAAAATDIVTISGSATKVIRVTKLIISGTQTTAGIVTFYLYRRSTANTGGTLSGGVTLVPLDSNNAAATATVNAYIGNPTALGTTVGAFDIFKNFLPTVALTSDYTRTNIEFGENTGQCFVLRGAAQSLAINLNGVTLAGNSLDVTLEWTEE